MLQKMQRETGSERVGEKERAERERTRGREGDTAENEKQRSDFCVDGPDFGVCSMLAWRFFMMVKIEKQKKNNEAAQCSAAA